MDEQKVLRNKDGRGGPQLHELSAEDKRKTGKKKNGVQGRKRICRGTEEDQKKEMSCAVIAYSSINKRKEEKGWYRTRKRGPSKDSRKKKDYQRLR